MTTIRELYEATLELDPGLLDCPLMVGIGNQYLPIVGAGGHSAKHDPAERMVQLFHPQDSEINVTLVVTDEGYRENYSFKVPST